MTEEKKNKKKILIVDDELEYARLVKTRLEYSGYSVDIAGDGQEALKKVKDNPDLILLDVMMPSLGGIEFSKILKENPDTQSIPIVFVTAKHDEQTRVEGMRAGADHFLFKPIEPKELLEVIKSFLGE